MTGKTPNVVRGERALGDLRNIPDEDSLHPDARLLRSRPVVNRFLNLLLADCIEEQYLVPP